MYFTTYYIASPEDLHHHGIKGQRWGIRRFRNYDGSLTERGKARLEKKDAKWAKKNYEKIEKKVYKKSEKEFNKFVKDDLNKRLDMLTKNGKLSKQYVNAYNQKMAELMNKNVGDLRSPSGRVVRFVAKRGEVGVHMALADAGFDMSTVKRGVYDSGRVAYKKGSLDKI